MEPNKQPSVIEWDGQLLELHGVQFITKNELNDDPLYLCMNIGLLHRIAELWRDYPLSDRNALIPLVLKATDPKTNVYDRCKELVDTFGCRTPTILRKKGIIRGDLKPQKSLSKDR